MKSQNPSLSKGLLITFEGGEGAGKTTLIESIHQHLTEEGYPVTSTKEPGDSPLGKHIRELLLHKHEISISNRAKLLLFLADRAQHIEELIGPKLKEHEIILCDRFTDSSLAYQGAEGDFDEDILQLICSFATSDLIPDLTFFLDLDPQVGLKRIHKTNQELDRIESEKLSFHEKVRNGFLALAEEETERFVILDASESPEEVSKTAIKAMEKRLNLI